MINTIVTHSGKFHGDEVVAIAILKAIYPGAKVVRSRDREVIDAADIAVDVGGGAYDHHQKGGNGRRPGGVEYASAGLVWRDFGHVYLWALGVHELLTDVFNDIDERFISAVDAIDNGGPTGELTLSSAISSFNTLLEGEDENAAFMEAVEMASKVLRRFAMAADKRIKAKEVVLEAMEASEDEILVLDQPVAWKETILSHWQGIKFLFAIIRGDKGQWMVQTIPVVLSPRQDRMKLPEAWGGLEGEALQKVTGVADAVFCHRGLFIAAAASKEGALALAKLALEA